MSRLSLIVKGKEVVKELFSFKTRKISNAIDSAISTAEEWKKKAVQSRRIKEMLAEEVDSESEE